MTKYCRKAIHYGISLCRKYSAGLYIIHVIHNPFGYEGWSLPMYSLEDYRRNQKETKKDLVALISSEQVNGLVVEEIIEEGPPTEQCRL